MKQPGNQESSFIHRLCYLRECKNISAREMSLGLSYNENYIRQIECGNCLPSMQAFFEICDYLGITPHDFFDETFTNPENASPFETLFHQLTPDQAHLVYHLSKELAARDIAPKKLLPARKKQIQ